MSENNHTSDLMKVALEPANSICNKDKVAGIIEYSQVMASFIERYHETGDSIFLNSFLDNIEPPLVSLGKFSSKIRIVQRSWNKEDAHFYSRKAQEKKEEILGNLESSIYSLKNLNPEFKNKIFEKATSSFVSPLLSAQNPCDVLFIKGSFLASALIKVASEVSLECKKTPHETERHLEEVFLREFDQTSDEGLMQTFSNAKSRYENLSEDTLIQELEQIDFNWKKIKKVFLMIEGIIINIAGNYCLISGAVMLNPTLLLAGILAVIIGVVLATGEISSTKEILEILKNSWPKGNG